MCLELELSEEKQKTFTSLSRNTVEEKKIENKDIGYYKPFCVTHECS